MTQKKKDFVNAEGFSIISAPIVRKKFVKKNGQTTDWEELYVRRSVQDYFIKFCESDVSREEMESHLAANNSPIKMLKLKVEFRTGEWDNCEEALEVQSRVGDYIIIHSIVK
jgi:hypothetical protein